MARPIHGEAVRAEGAHVGDLVEHEDRGQRGRLEAAAAQIQLVAPRDTMRQRANPFLSLRERQRLEHVRRLHAHLLRALINKR